MLLLVFQPRLEIHYTPGSVLQSTYLSFYNLFSDVCIAITANTDWQIPWYHSNQASVTKGMPCLWEICQSAHHSDHMRWRMAMHWAPERCHRLALCKKASNHHANLASARVIIKVSGHQHQWFPGVSPGGYNVKLYISRGRLAWWLLAFLYSVCEQQTMWLDNRQSNYLTKSERPKFSCEFKQLRAFWHTGLKFWGLFCSYLHLDAIRVPPRSSQ